MIYQILLKKKKKLNFFVKSKISKKWKNIIKNSCLIALAARLSGNVKYRVKSVINQKRALNEAIRILGKISTFC
jgi:hypothetical protein